MPYGRFQRAIVHRDLLGAEAAAREMGGLYLADALDLLLLIARKEPARFERAAVRWHGRFEVEVPGLQLADAQLLLGALAGLREPAPRVALESIALLAERVRQNAVAATARRRA